MNKEQTIRYAKKTDKDLNQQIDVVAEFHANKISALRIAYRTGVDAELVSQLIKGQAHQRLFTALLAKHRRNRRNQRLKKSLRTKGIAQATLQDQIEQEYHESTIADRG
jgi:hypothetical protein